MSQTERFDEASGLLASRGMRVYANVAIGLPFMTPAEAVEDARSSATWALEHGADLVVLFPMHVKAHTLLAHLHEHGRYSSPSLWAIVDVLTGLDPNQLPRVTISWYRPNCAAVGDIIASPGICRTCSATVLSALDGFRAAPSAATLAELTSIECRCRDAWRALAAEVPGTSLPERVLTHYEQIAAEFELSDWSAPRTGPP
jgi:uncharacterized Fe-S cluster-containing MiaB family protein